MSTILVIDDDDSYRRVCGLALTGMGFQVLSAENGAKGLQCLAESAVDLVITDILMPDTDGIETIMTIRKNHPHLPMVAISGGGTVAAEQCLALSAKLGAVAALRKPFTLDELVDTVRRVLASSRPDAPFVAPD